MSKKKKYDHSVKDFSKYGGVWCRDCTNLGDSPHNEKLFCLLYNHSIIKKVGCMPSSAIREAYKESVEWW